MALIVNIPSILVGVSLNPIFQGLLIYFNDNAENDDQNSFRIVSIGIVRKRAYQVILGILALGFPIAWIFEAHLFTPFMIASLYSLDSIRVFEQRLLTAARRQREAAMISVGDIFFRLVFVWALLHIFGSSAYLAVAGNIIGALLFVLAMYLFGNYQYLPSRQPLVGMEKKTTIEEKVLDFSKPLVPSAILANVTEMGNRYLIGAILGLQATGLFVAAYGLVKRPYGMLNYVGEMVMSPALREAIRSERADEIARTRRQYLLFITSFSLVGALLFSVLSEILVAIFLSNNYMPIAELLPSIALAIALFNIANVFNWFSMTLGRSRAVLINNMVGSSATILLTIVFCFLIGIEGAVFSLLAGYSLQLLVSIFTFNESNKSFNFGAEA